MKETQVLSLGQEDSLEEQKATHPSILAWEISWTEEPGGLQLHGIAKSRTRLSMHTLYGYMFHPLYLPSKGGEAQNQFQLLRKKKRRNLSGIWLK